MNAEYWLSLAAIVILLVCSAMFTGCRTALLAASRPRMQGLEKKGNSRAGLVARLKDERERLVGALLIGNNLANVTASILAASLALRQYGSGALPVAVLAMTLLIVFFCEAIPRSLSFAYPDRFALAVAPLAYQIVRILSPAAMLISFIARWLLGSFGMRPDQSFSRHSLHDEIRGAVDVLAREGDVVKDDRYRLGAILDLHELDVSDIMVHRTKMFSVDCEQPPKEILTQILESPYTRVPLWKGDPENFVGIVHSRDVLRILARGEDIAGFDIMKIVSPPWFVPETTPLKDQLNAFLRRKAHIALVVDEYGEVMGLVTLEDILEEIVGEIADEHDIEVSGVQVQPDGSVIVDGSVSIRDLNRALDWDLPDEEATTIAGLVIHEAQTIPEEKQAFTFYGKRFLVLGREKNRITRLRVRQVEN